MSCFGSTLQFSLAICLYVVASSVPCCCFGVRREEKRWAKTRGRERKKERRAEETRGEKRRGEENRREKRTKYRHERLRTNSGRNSHLSEKAGWDRPTPSYQCPRRSTNYSQTNPRILRHGGRGARLEGACTSRSTGIAQDGQWNKKLFVSYHLVKFPTTFFSEKCFREHRTCPKSNHTKLGNGLSQTVT